MAEIQIENWSPRGGIAGDGMAGGDGHALLPPGETNRPGCPIVLVHGTHDELIPMQDSEVLLTLAKKRS